MAKGNSVTPEVADHVQARSYSIRQFPPVVKRTRIGAWFSAFLAVWAKIPLASYLDNRLRNYLSKKPQLHQPFPEIAIVQNQIVVGETPVHPLLEVLEDPSSETTGPSADPRQAEFRFLRASREGEAQALLRDLQEAEEESARDAERALEATQRLDEMKREYEREIAEGKVLSNATAKRKRSERGRPGLGFPWKDIVLASLVVVLLVAEVWGFCGSALNWFGVDISNLGGAWRRNWLGVLGGVAFGIAAFVAVCFIVEVLVVLFRRVFSDKTPRARKYVDGALAGLAVLVTAVFAWDFGRMRQGLGEGSQLLLTTSHGQAAAPPTSGGLSFILLTFLLPAALVGLLHIWQRLEKERETLRSAQREWDLRQIDFVDNGDRRDELLRLAEKEKQAADDRKDQARQRIQALNERAHAAEQALRASVDAESRLMESYVNSLVAALARDRHAFEFEARRRDRDGLLDPEFSHRTESGAVLVPLRRIPQEERR